MELPPHVARLSASLAEALLELGEVVELFLVGGLVRDLLLGAPVGHDLDFATSASPRQTERALKAAHGQVFKIGEKFGTIGGIFNDLQVEGTTYRTEAYQPASRNPEDSFGTRA